MQTSKPATHPRRDLLRAGAVVGTGLTTLVLPTGAAAASGGGAFPTATSTGALDSTLPDLNINGTVRAVAIDAQDRILIGGEFTSVGGETRNRIARLADDGTVDGSFAPSLDNNVESLTIDDAGRIIVTGKFTTVGGVSRSGVARLLADGSLDTSFTDPGLVAPSGDLEVHAAVVQAGTGGSILVVGNLASSASSPAYTGIARLTSTGAVDTTFAAITLNGRGYGVAVLPDGNIAIGGYFTSATQGGSSPVAPRFAVLDAGGTLITPVPIGFASDVYRVQVDPSGQILVAGRFNSFFGGAGPAKVARMDVAGARDLTFTGAAFDSEFGANSASVQSMLPISGGKLIVGGFFTQVDGTARGYLAQLNADGTLDTSFADVDVAGTSRNVWALAVDGQGRVVIGGAFDRIGGATGILRRKLARFA